MNYELLIRALRTAIDDLQLISDEGEGSHGKTIDLLIDALDEVNNGK